MAMSSKRKLDIADTDFEFLHNYLLQMSKISVADAKSMLLMIKSFSPNSLKLKQVEYELAKDNGDINGAAHLFSQLFSSGRELLGDEICTLFDGLKRSPPDKTSFDIFTRLSHSTQRDLFNAYFAGASCSLSERADLLLYLLSLKEILSQVQLVPTLISLTYRVLRDGEASLAKSSHEQLVFKPESTATIQAESSESPLRPSKFADGDEGEEGEVFGDDDDEDDPMLDSKPAVTESNSCKRTLTLCDYRRTVTYELLPIAYQTFESTKLEKRTLEKIINLSLNFLYQSMASVSDQPLVFGSEKRRSILLKPPREYIIDCLKMGTVLLQWPLSLFVKQESSDEQCQVSDVSILKPEDELLTVLDDSWEEISLEQKQTSHLGESEGNNKRRRGAQRKEDASHSISKVSAIAHQSVALFWTLLLSTTEKYISLTRPHFAQLPTVANEKRPVSSYPLDMSFIFPRTTMHREPFTQPSTSTPFTVLVHLWQFRKYKQVPELYTLGSRELDIWDAAIRPSSTTACPALETIACFDLTLSGFLSAPWTVPNIGADRLQELAVVDDLITSLCPLVDHDLLRWIICAYSFNPFTQKPWNDPVGQRQNFVKNLNKVLVNSCDSESLPVQMSETCWLFPLTQGNISYLGLKVIAHWLSSHVTHNSDSVHLTTVCLACILCQIDTLRKPGSFLTHLWPSPFQKILQLIGSRWSEARVRFLKWIKPPISALTDSSLINELVRLEADWLVLTEATHSDFMEACVRCLKSQTREPICARLLRFLQAELDDVLCCLKSN